MYTNNNHLQCKMVEKTPNFVTKGTKKNRYLGVNLIKNNLFNNDNVQNLYEKNIRTLL